MADHPDRMNIAADPLSEARALALRLVESQERIAAALEAQAVLTFVFGQGLNAGANCDGVAEYCRGLDHEFTESLSDPDEAEQE